MPYDLAPLIAQAAGHATGYLLGGYLGDETLVAEIATAGFEGALRSWTVRRIKLAIGILGHEAERGNKDLTAASEEDGAAMTAAYLDAAARGAAEHNLSFMARILTGEAPSRPLHADDFIRHVSRVATLSRQEVILLADFYREWCAAGDQPEDHAVFAASAARLIPTVFRDGIDYEAAAMGLTRTGYLAPTVKGLGGAIHYTPSEELRKVAALARFHTWDEIKVPPKDPV